ncbi:uncharacterized protein DSM5745_02526 [Aspergillus mulundensis]|uniref:Uncharacterized protein n=1 Tax=Aspergillus mulundensis TaxID=1810919 RepID=A0A3D8SX61_9EURO|nr:hypothetical protein DSM5745_02526 [Aspergillus mulundensis]RDW90751.1 hypothetical protein DSM5745_02526 [Aspergillus mulundensis]
MSEPKAADETVDERVDAADAREVTGEVSTDDSNHPKIADVEGEADDANAVEDLDSDRADDIWVRSLKRAIENDSLEDLGPLLETEGALDKKFESVIADDKTPIAGLTPFLFAAALGRVEVVDKLLRQGVDVNAQTTDFGSNAFHLAAMFGQVDVMQSLLSEENSAHLLEQRRPDGWNALMYAAEWGQTEAVKLLLDRDAAVDVADEYGRTTLHMACYRGYEKVFDLLLERLQNKSAADGYTSAKKVITKKDTYGDTALDDAASQGHTGIVLRLLNTPTYFPLSPLQADIVRSDDDHADVIANVLMAWKHDDPSDVDEEAKNAAGYWAILHGRNELITKFGPPPLNRNGVTWAHVAALSGYEETLKRFVKKRQHVLRTSPGPTGLTPLHVAVKYGRNKLAQTLVDILVKEGTDKAQVLNDLLVKTKEGQTPFELAALGGTENHRAIEELLWVEIDGIVQSIPDFFNAPDETADLVLELAARFDNPGSEKPSKLELQNDCNALHWAVFYQNPIMVWWLLANGAYTRESDITRADSINKEMGKDEDTKDLIQRLLFDPPPISKRRPPVDDNHAPSFQFGPLWKYKSDIYESHIHKPDISGTILDFYHGEGKTNFRRKRGPLLDIIYNRGPQKFMRYDGYHDLSALKKRLVAKEPDVVPGEPDVFKPATKAMVKDPIKTEQQQLRWFFIPVNDLELAEVMPGYRLLDAQANGFQELMFVRRSWAELPAGGRKFYMRPQCVSERKQQHKNGTTTKDKAAQSREATKVDSSEKPKSRKGRVAIYMPFLSWMKLPAKGAKERRQSAPVMDEVTRDDTAPEHKPMTLDQYYYVSLDNTRERDQDQVLERYIGEEKKRRKQRRQDHLANGSPKDESSSDNLPEKEFNELVDKTAEQILVVHQLWLWRLDGETIITSTSEEPDGSDNTFMQHMVNALNHQGKNSPTSDGSLIELIVNTAVGMFLRKNITIMDTRKSPLEVFRDSIRVVRDKEAKLFERFKESLTCGHQGYHGGDSTSTARSHTDQQTPRNRFPRVQKAGSSGMSVISPTPNHKGPGEAQEGNDSTSTATSHADEKENIYYNIDPETTLLKEIKDICDELNILKNLAEDQEDVWRQVCKLEGSTQTPGTPSAYITPKDIKDEITEMVKEAEAVQMTINSLLNLKQKQANLEEAKSAREQAQATAKQTDTIMVFTIVTIVFLPLSFLTSLFALNISNFPHKGDEVLYQGWWIFPILFGVSVIVSGFFMVVAFKASDLKEYLGLGPESEDGTAKKSLRWSVRMPSFRQRGTPAAADNHEADSEDSRSGDKKGWFGKYP